MKNEGFPAPPPRSRLRAVAFGCVLLLMVVGGLLHPGPHCCCTDARQRQRQTYCQPAHGELPRVCHGRCTQITPRPSVLQRAPRRAPRLTCPTITPAGAVAGVYLFQEEQKRKQGASAPEVIKAQAGEDIMRKREHGTCLACSHSASATQSLKTIKPPSQTITPLPPRLGVCAKP
jgi:hypothetical protein